MVEKIQFLQDLVLLFTFCQFLRFSKIYQFYELKGAELQNIDIIVKVLVMFRNCLEIYVSKPWDKIRVILSFSRTINI